MPLTIVTKPSNDSQFFEKVCLPEALEQYKFLQKLGLKSEIGLFTIKLTCQGYMHKVTLSVSASSLMKKPINQFDSMDKNACLEVSHEIFKMTKSIGVGTPSITKAAYDVTKMVDSDYIGSGPGYFYAKSKNSPNEEAADVQKVVEVQKSADVQKAAKFFNKKTLRSMPRVFLRNADMLGQPVNGTDSASVYYVAALSPSVKVAIRFIGKGLSFRVEGTISDKDRKNLMENGFTPKMKDHKENHWSLQLIAEPKHRSRALGALLMGLGLEFTQQVNSIYLVDEK